MRALSLAHSASCRNFFLLFFGLDRCNRLGLYLQETIIDYSLLLWLCFKFVCHLDKFIFNFLMLAVNLKRCYSFLAAEIVQDEDQGLR